MGLGPDHLWPCGSGCWKNIRYQVKVEFQINKKKFFSISMSPANLSFSEIQIELGILYFHFLNLANLVMSLRKTSLTLRWKLLEGWEQRGRM